VLFATIRAIRGQSSFISVHQRLENEPRMDTNEHE